MSSKIPPGLAAERAAFYETMAPHNLAPLWEVLSDLVTPVPTTPAVPARWRYADARSFLMRAGELITATEAERRVLVLENPAMRGRSAITHTLYAGLQLIMPGEVAPAHRHTQAALRFVMEGDGACTTVNGKRADMHVGDLILTPSWTWHSHGNDTQDPMIWLDGLDVPLVAALDASFSQRAEQRSSPAAIKQPAPAPAPAPATATATATIVDTNSTRHPVFVFPHAQWRESLERMRHAEEWDAHDGVRMEFLNPSDGSALMPTMSAFCQLIPKGHATRAKRSTDGSVYVVSEGQGRVTIGEQAFDLTEGDVFVVPSWHARAFTPTSDLVLFSFSDRSVQQKLGLWREELA